MNIEIVRYNLVKKFLKSEKIINELNKIDIIRVIYIFLLIILFRIIINYS